MIRSLTFRPVLDTISTECVIETISSAGTWEGEEFLRVYINNRLLTEDERRGVALESVLPEWACDE